MVSFVSALASNLLLLLALTPLAAERAAGPARDARVLAGELKAVLGNLPEAGAACSADVVDLNSGQRIFEANADTAMVPASNAKVFTLAAAIDGLGANFQFRTVLATRGPDVIVVGDGDPSLGDPEGSEKEGRPITAVFDEWAEQLKRKGLSVIQGDLVIDESIFDDQRIHPDWDKWDIKSYYLRR